MKIKLRLKKFKVIAELSFSFLFFAFWNLAQFVVEQINFCVQD